MTQRRIFCFYIIAFFFINDTESKSSRPNILNVSREPPSPIAFWPLKTNLHDAVAVNGRRYAIISDGRINHPGINWQYGAIPASSARTITIPNSNEFLQGHDAMTWLFYVRIGSSQTATFLQYSGIGSNTGFTFGLNGNKLVISCRDNTNKLYSFQSDFTIPTDGTTWSFIGFTFNKLWTENDHIDFLYFPSNSPIRTTVAMGAVERTVNAYGDIMIGSNHDNTKQLNGDIACIQFYNTSLLGGTLEDSIDLCDPNLGQFPAEASCGAHCALSAWSSWSTCSATCGGGIRARHRDICCPDGMSQDDCLTNICPPVTLQQSQTCNTICSNGGTYLGGCVCQGGWSGECCDSIVRCLGDPEIPNNSRLVVQGYLYMNKSAVVCDTGYAISSGDAIRHCNGTAQWNGTKPVCSLASWYYSPMEGHGKFSHLLLDKSTLSKQQRLLYSVYEDRPSKVMIGTSGIVIICLFVSYFIIMDVVSMCRVIFNN